MSSNPKKSASRYVPPAGGKKPSKLEEARKKAEAIKTFSKNPAQHHLASLNYQRAKIEEAKQITPEELEGVPLDQVNDLIAQKELKAKKLEERFNELQGELAGSYLLNDSSLEYLGTGMKQPSGFTGERKEIFRALKTQKLLDTFKKYRDGVEEAKATGDAEAIRSASNLKNSYRRNLFTKLARANQKKKNMVQKMLSF